MVRRPLLAFTAALIAVLSVDTSFAQGARPRRSQSKPVASIKTTAAVPFSPVERLDYTVDWNNNVTAAQLSLTVAERGKFFDRDALRIRCEARTIGFARFAAALDATIETFVDPVSLLTIRANRESTINGKTSTQSLVFDRRKNTVTSSNGTSNIGIETADTLALLYRFRAKIPAVGKTIVLDGIEGDRRLEMRATVEGREEVTTPAGSFQAIRVAFVPVNNGAPDDRSKIRAWFAEDRGSIPVLFTAEPNFGPIRVALANASLTESAGVRGE